MSPSPQTASHLFPKKDWVLLMIITLLVGISLVILIPDPLYTDSYYYYNAGERLVDGEGLTDPYLWNYLNPPDELPAPSYTYWMPLPSIVSATSMVILGTTFDVAQLPFVLALMGMVGLTAWMAIQFRLTRYQIWAASLIVLFGAFYFPFWTIPSTFTLFGVFGCAALLAISIGIQKHQWYWWISCGMLSGFAHLTRADGLLFVLIALLVLGMRLRKKFLPYGSLLLVGYVGVMLPWFIRNITVIRSPLPSGGAETAFLLEYNDLFEYPVHWSFAEFSAWGIENIAESRWEAFLPNLGTFIAVEGFVILMPFALYALWKNRHHQLLTGFILYALALHVLMTFVFAFPGYRGGLFHSSAALVPFWAVLGSMGVSDFTERLGKWRRWEEIGQAKLVLHGISVGVVIFVAGFALARQLIEPASRDDIPTLDDLAVIIREDSPDNEPVLMMNDPAEWYYHTRLTGVTLPDAPLERLPEIAERYCVTYLVIDKNVTKAFKPLLKEKSIPPDFLVEVQSFFIEIEDSDNKTSMYPIRIYRFRQDQLDYAEHCPQF